MPYKTIRPEIGGILLIVAAGISSLIGFFGLILFSISTGYRGFNPDYEALSMMILGVVSLTFGLATGLLSMKRKRLDLVVAGAFVSAFQGFLVLFECFEYAFVWGFYTGVPAILVSL